MSGDGLAALRQDRGTSWAVAALVAAGYALGAGCSWILFHTSPVAVFYPPAGITVGALLLTPRRRWPWVLGAAAAVELSVDLWHRLSPAIACGFVLVNTVEPLVGASLLRRWRPRTLNLTRRSDALLFIGCCVVAGPFVGSLVGATTIALGLGQPWWGAVAPYWAGDGLAVLTLGAAIAGTRSRDLTDLRRNARTVLFLLATAALTVVGFWPHDVPLAYLPVPLLVVAAFRARVNLVAAAGFVMAFTANLMTAAGHGPWAALMSTPRLEVATLQVFLALAVLGAWLLAIAVVERDEARAVSAREAAARRRLQALQNVTAGLATAATSEQIAAVLAERGVGPVADAGAVALADARGDGLRIWLTDRSGAATGPTRVTAADADDLPVTHAARIGRAVVLTSPEELATRFPRWSGGLSSLLAVPVQVGDRSVGALAIGYRAATAPDDEVVAVAETLASLAAQSLERAQLYEAEHEAAHQLQQALLPRIATHLPGARAGVRYRPAERGRDVGGDWYDVFELPGNRVGFAVGDVVGHDLPAATAMGRLQQVLRSVAMSGAEPAHVLEVLDEAGTNIAGADCATVGYAEYSPLDGVITYACAGHPPPLLVADGEARFLGDGRSPPLRTRLGLRPQARVTAPPGAMLVWYSDGLLERRGESIDMGLKRLADFAEGLTGDDPQAWCDAIMTDMTGGDVVADDVVVACLQLTGASWPADGPAVLRRTLTRPSQLAATRDALRAWAARQCLSPARTDDLLTACGEILANALEHGSSGPVDLRVLRADRWQIRVDVTDRGGWRPRQSDATRERGLAVVSRVAERISLDLGRNGTRLTVVLSLR